MQEEYEYDDDEQERSYGSLIGEIWRRTPWWVIGLIAVLAFIGIMRLITGMMTPYEY